MSRVTVPAALPWWAAALSLLAAAGLALGLTPHWQAEAAAADRAGQRLARHAPAAAVLAAARPGDDQRLLQALATVDAAPQRVADLLALAQHHGLQVDSTRQTWAPPPGRGALPLQRLQLVLVARGPYAALRQFTAEALQHDDTLLLDQLRLARAPAQATALQAELQWSLLLRSDVDASR